uniref:Uncharacterized protein n=1 Tax=Arundo donax TaxID=35708 RepID=A0A0A9A8M8_ARUDO
MIPLDIEQYCSSSTKMLLPFEQ